MPQTTATTTKKKKRKEGGGSERVGALLTPPMRPVDGNTQKRRRRRRRRRREKTERHRAAIFSSQALEKMFEDAQDAAYVVKDEELRLRRQIFQQAQFDLFNLNERRLPARPKIEGRRLDTKTSDDNTREQK